MRGTIRTLKLGRVFGFIRGDDRKDYFFHADDLEGLEFTEQLQERRVEFVEFEEAKGPRAKSVRAVD
jgi:cold shock CspA family protein